MALSAVIVVARISLPVLRRQLLVGQPISLLLKGAHRCAKRVHPGHFTPLRPALSVDIEMKLSVPHLRVLSVTLDL